MKVLNNNLKFSIGKTLMQRLKLDIENGWHIIQSNMQNLK